MNEFNYEGWIGKVVGLYDVLPSTGSEGQIYIVVSGDKGTAYVWDNATSEFVEFGGGSIEGAIVYKGKAASASDLPATPENGWLYIATAPFTLTEGNVDAGDMLIYDEDDTQWDIFQGNITIEDLQSDWNENNASSAAYVKNRPFYEVNSETIEIESTIYARGYDMEQVANGYELELNKTYTVTLDGVTYENLASESWSAGGLDFIGIGDLSLAKQDSSPSPNIPFLYSCVSMSGTLLGAMVVIEISGSQTITVVESGSSDTPWSYTFTASGQQHSIDFMCSNSSSRTTYNSSYDYFTWNAGSFELTEGDEYTVTFNGTDYTCQAATWTNPVAGVYLSDGDEPYPTPTNVPTFFVGTYDDNGVNKVIYGINNTGISSDFYGSIPFPITVKSGSTVVYQLNPKYIPTASSIASGASGYTTGGQVYDYVLNNGFNPSSMSTVDLANDFGTWDFRASYKPASSKVEFRKVNKNSLPFNGSIDAYAMVLLNGQYYNLTSLGTHTCVDGSFDATLAAGHISLIGSGDTLVLKLGSADGTKLYDGSFTIPLRASSIADGIPGFATGDQVYDYVATQIGNIETLLAQI